MLSFRFKRKNVMFTKMRITASHERGNLKNYISEMFNGRIFCVLNDDFVNFLFMVNVLFDQLDLSQCRILSLLVSIKEYTDDIFFI